MNGNRLAVDWIQAKRSVRARWARLTDDDLEAIDGRRDRLLGRLREIYASNEAQVEAELRDWERHQEPIAPAAPAGER